MIFTQPEKQRDLVIAGWMM